MRNQFRIIAGDWRSRRCRFPDRRGLRPTPDRVRETLFNWLGHRIVGAHCLDLFAGSGALGIESLSRGAARVVFVESDREVAAGVKATIARLGGERSEVIVDDACHYLGGTPERFDLVFLDPPFASDLLPSVLPELADWVRDDTRLYLEYPAKAGMPVLPPGFNVLKSSRAGQVGFALAANAG
jgi:16S rRNA (guanine966-N2)-methyltransferase